METLLDRLDHWSLCAAFSAAIVYFSSTCPWIHNLDHYNVPFLHGEHQHIAPFTAITAYLLMVHVVRPIVQKGMELRRSLILWNQFLWVLSMTMLFGISAPILKYAWENPSLQRIICDPDQERWEG